MQAVLDLFAFHVPFVPFVPLVPLVPFVPFVPFMHNSLNIEKLLAFIDGSPTQFHAAAKVVDCLEAHGFERLREDEPWRLAAGGRYFVERNASSVLAFALPELPSAIMPLRLAAVHLDSPLLKLKLKGAKCDSAGVATIPVDVYGGPILATWLDRPLGIAGMLFSEADGRVVERLYDCPNAAVIPNAAIHLNRDINGKGAVYNPQNELNAIVGMGGLDVASALGIPEDALDDSELFLYDSSKAALVGAKKEMVNSSRLDNLLSAFAALEALPKFKSQGAQFVPMAFFADNEEIGSQTLQGADSDFLPCVVRRMLSAFGAKEDDVCAALARSRMISADAAHAEHPNYRQFYEPNYAPQMGHGIALKRNTKFRYASNGRDCAEFRRMCKEAGIACQDFVNRADMPCGSTVGAAISAALGVAGVDIGVPMLAMHSIRETAALDDVFGLQRVFEAFWK